MGKYKLTWKDLTWNDFKTYFFALFKAFVPKKKINDLEDLENFIQSKSAWVTQVTLYNYLKTRMGTKWVLHFDDEIFLKSINTAKWNIYAISLQDLSFYTVSYLNVFYDYKETGKSSEIYNSILNKELENGMPKEIVDEARIRFKNRLEKIKWDDYYKSLPFNESALALYNWAPIANELKTLDRKIVLNSMILKWDNIKEEFSKRVKI